MHFVHIIEINDPRNPLLTMFTPEQVWRGLLRRVERPKDFLPQLNRCHIVLRGDRTLVRELDFGAFVVRDRVRLTPQREITFDTDSAPNISTARLTISVEQPSEHQLQLRFTYHVQRQPADDAEMEAHYDRYLQAAYLQADIESVKIMRMLLAEGAL